MDEAIFRAQTAVDGAPGFREDDPPVSSDDEVARLYRIRCSDGVATEAFEDELITDEVSETG